MRRDTDATGEGDAAINDEDFSMGTIIQPSQIRPVWRMKFTYLHTCRFHFLDERLIHFGAADPVE